MAGETIKTEAVCLAIRPWSKTSHVVAWLTPRGRVVTVVKGAVRPKSFFLGQYDLNYTCEILYYARAKGEVHALREAVALDRRDFLRDDYRSLLLAEHFRQLAGEYAPAGPEAADWHGLLTRSLDSLAAPAATAADRLRALLGYELDVLKLSGLSPVFTGSEGLLALRGERNLPVAPATAACLADPANEKNLKILLDAARVIGVFYTLTLDAAPESRRSLLKIICNNEQGQNEK